MRDLPYMEGLGHLARIGYKHVEITLRSGWNTEPRLMTRANRAEIRKRIGDLGLTLVDVMEGMQPASNVTVEENLERLRAAAEMAHECSPGAPALIGIAALHPCARPAANGRLYDPVATAQHTWDRLSPVFR